MANEDDPDNSTLFLTGSKDDQQLPPLISLAPFYFSQLLQPDYRPSLRHEYREPDRPPPLGGEE